MTGDQAGTVLHGEGFIRTGSKRLGIHGVLFLLDVEIQRESGHGKTGRDVEIHPYLRALHGSHVILDVH